MFAFVWRCFLRWCVCTNTVVCSPSDKQAVFVGICTRVREGIYALIALTVSVGGKTKANFVKGAHWWLDFVSPTRLFHFVYGNCD